MDLRWTEEDEKFRQEVRSYFEANLPKEWPEEPAEDFKARREFQKKLSEDRWVAIHWPEEHGGRGASLMQTVIYNEEYARVRGPILPNALGLSLLGPTLMVHGNDAQKKRFLPKVLSAEEIWCQGFSEPNAGSDLAGLQCRAELDGDEFVVNGQKIWTSYGKYGDWIFTLVRTDASGPKHQGISFLLIDMHSPGVEVRPLKEMTGESVFAEIFFTDVRVPKENLVGEPGDGWNIAMTTLTFERGAGGLAVSHRLKNSLNDLIGDARKLRLNGKTAFEDPVVRSKIARRLVELEVYRYNSLRAISGEVSGKSAGPAASINKLYWSEWHQRFTEEAVKIIGPQALIDGSRWGDEFLSARAETIYAGTSEIQRNILAERVLGLPKERKE